MCGVPKREGHWAVVGGDVGKQLARRLHLELVRLLSATVHIALGRPNLGLKHRERKK